MDSPPFRFLVAVTARMELRTVISDLAIMAWPMSLQLRYEHLGAEALRELVTTRNGKV